MYRAGASLASVSAPTRLRVVKSLIPRCALQPRAAGYADHATNANHR